MLIDWFTVIAQALNFLLLVWLLRRFLYRPVLAAVDAREARIKAELANADAAQAEAERARAEFVQKSADLEQQRAARLAEAAAAAEAERARGLEAARQAADALGAKRREALRREARALDEAVGAQVQREVFEIARQALADLADAALEQRLVEVFVRRIAAIDGDPKARFVAALRTGAEPAHVRTAFALTPAQQATIQGAIEGAFAPGLTLRFATDPALIGGIEITVGGQKLAWSIADYLTTLEASVAALVDPPVADAAPAPASR